MTGKEEVQVKEPTLTARDELDIAKDLNSNLKRHKCIFLNENLDEHELYFVMAHELGHAVLHPKQNCYFFRNKTLLFDSLIELEANKFAIELLLSDDMIDECRQCQYTLDQISRLTGYHKKLIELKLK